MSQPHTTLATLVTSQSIAHGNEIVESIAESVAIYQIEVRSTRLASTS